MCIMLFLKVLKEQTIAAPVWTLTWKNSGDSCSQKFNLTKSNFKILHLYSLVWFYPPSLMSVLKISVDITRLPRCLKLYFQNLGLYVYQIQHWTVESGNSLPKKLGRLNNKRLNHFVCACVSVSFSFNRGRSSVSVEDECYMVDCKLVILKKKIGCIVGTFRYVFNWQISKFYRLSSKMGHNWW